MLKNGMRPVHPGEILREDFQKEMGFSAAALARAARTVHHRGVVQLGTGRATGDQGIRVPRAQLVE